MDEGPYYSILLIFSLPFCLDFICGDYQEDNWGKVYLNEFNNGWSQKWQIDGKEIICKVENLRLDVHSSATHNGAKVGVYQQTGNPNQQWQLQGKLEFIFTWLGLGMILTINSQQFYSIF